MGNSAIARSGKTWGLWHDRLDRIRIKLGDDRLAAELSGHPHVGGEIIRRTPRDTAHRHATITVTVEDTAVVVDRDLIKIEQVAILMAATCLPDSAHVLHRIVRGSIDSSPGNTAVVGRGDVCVPFARETVGLLVTVYVGPEEANCGAARATS